VLRQCACVPSIKKENKAKKNRDFRLRRFGCEPSQKKKNCFHMQSKTSYTQTQRERVCVCVARESTSCLKPQNGCVDERVSPTRTPSRRTSGSVKRGDKKWLVIRLEKRRWPNANASSSPPKSRISIRHSNGAHPLPCLTAANQQKQKIDSNNRSSADKKNVKGTRKG
jgi:hypothetical protein